LRPTLYNVILHTDFIIKFVHVFQYNFGGVKSARISSLYCVSSSYITSQNYEHRRTRTVCFYLATTYKLLYEVILLSQLILFIILISIFYDMFWPTWQASDNKKHTHNVLEKIGNTKFYKRNKPILPIFYIPVGARFSVAVQTAPGVQVTFYTTGTGSCPNIKRPGCGADHAPLSSDEVKERGELYIQPFSGSPRPVPG